MTLSWYLNHYLMHRPAFLGLIRAKEASLYQRFLPLPAPVLDVGCGDGFFAQMVFAKLDTGLDVTDSRIDQAGQANVYNRLLTYDGEHFPLPSNSYATVVSNCVLEHVEKLTPVVKETFRVLKPGGKFLVTVMAQPWENSLVGSLVMGNTYRQWLRRQQVHVNLLMASEWQKQFTRVGFKINSAIGYLSPAACRLIEVFHYLSVPSLVSYLLFKRWNLFSVPWVNTAWVRKILSENVTLDQSGALFFELQKPKRSKQR